MPHCIVCKTSFYHMSFSGPAEPCDCDLDWEYDREDATPPDPEELADARAAWARGEMPTRCAHCERFRTVRDYNDGYTPEPLLLCIDCEQNEAERANERAQRGGA
jgi:hypothetical protein